jgi:hypothetical protein
MLDQYIDEVKTFLIGQFVKFSSKPWAADCSNARLNCEIDLPAQAIVIDGLVFAKTSCHYWGDSVKREHGLAGSP